MQGPVTYNSIQFNVFHSVENQIPTVVTNPLDVKSLENGQFLLIQDITPAGIYMQSLENKSNLKKDEVKEQILKWLSQEQDWKVEVSTDPYYYFTCLVRLSESMGCNICIENRIERVNVIGNAMLSQSDRINYKLLSLIHI